MRRLVRHGVGGSRLAVPAEVGRLHRYHVLGGVWRHRQRRYSPTILRQRPASVSGSKNLQAALSPHNQLGHIGPQCRLVRCSDMSAIGGEADSHLATSAVHCGEQSIPPISSTAVIARPANEAKLPFGPLLQRDFGDFKQFFPAGAARRLNGHSIN